MDDKDMCRMLSKDEYKGDRFCFLYIAHMRLENLMFFTHTKMLFHQGTNIGFVGEIIKLVVRVKET